MSSARWLAQRAFLARTAAGSAELSRPANSLSVPQRKLLMAIQAGTDYASLMATGAPEERSRRDRDLVKLFDLGLVMEVDAGGNPVAEQPAANPITVFGPLTLPGRAAPAKPLASAAVGAAGRDARQDPNDRPAREPDLIPFPQPVVKPASPLPFVLGGAALLIAVVAWWLLRGDTAPHPDAGTPPRATESASGSAAPQQAAGAAVAPAGTAPGTAPSGGGMPASSTLSQPPLSAAAPVAVSAGETGTGTTGAAPARGLAPNAGNGTDPRTPLRPATAGTPASGGPAAQGPQKVVATAQSQAQPPAATATGAQPATRSAAPTPAPATLPAPAVQQPAAAATPAPAPVPAPVAVTPPTEQPRPAPAPASQPAQQSAPTAATATASAPTPAPAAPAAAAPAAAAPAAPRLVNRVNPDFPREAAVSGITSGTVRARMRVGPDGSVTAVDILQSTPARVFDRAVVRALSQWKYEPTGQSRTVEHEVEFR